MSLTLQNLYPMLGPTDNLDVVAKNKLLPLP